MQYRADIDGLRAIAVLPVVAFHAGISGFSGGYVGVDVFFVISGFLITSIILEEIRSDRFSLVRFYERRCRRILPALFVVLMTTTVLASILLIPSQFEEFAESLVYTSLFVSTFHFSGEPGCFDLSSEFAPLLHTWSLSVEEIFYVVFPVLMILCFRPSSSRIGRWILLCVCLLSFLGATFALARNPESRSAFYFPHARAWELLLGGMAVLFSSVAQRLSRMAGPLSFAGVAMILSSVVFYSSETTFPGPAALLPCLGTWLVIAFGGIRKSFVTDLLAHPGLVWIGRASFSLYLWHWPLLVMMRTIRGAALSNAETAGVLVVSALLSFVTLFWVERPFRGAGGILSSQQIFLAAAGITLAFAAFGTFGKISGGWPSRYTGAERAIVEASRDIDPRRYECLQSLERDGGCLYGATNRSPTVGLWGDSHAAMYSSALGEVAQRNGTSALVFTMSSCAPANRYVGPNHPWGDACENLQAKALKTFIETKSITTVILAARWHGHDLHHSNPDLDAALRDAIARLRTAGKTVAIIHPIPEFGQDLPQVLTNMLLTGDPPAELSIERSDFEARHEAETAYLASLPEDLLHLHPADEMCDTTKCYFFRDGRVFSHDAHHLSVTGAQAIAEIFQPLFTNNAN
jgi:peptidoglycan/LPS O-acetylase OafA/YrhL